MNLTEWKRKLAPYARPDRRRAIGQICNTFLPYAGLCGAMVYLVRGGYPFWTMVLPAVAAAFFLIRIFIFFHDCCHGSFFASRRANRILGYVAGTLTFTPFEDWRRWHNGHHSGSGDLDRRGMGDVRTMTTDEYRAAPWRQRLSYRLLRHPLVLFGLGGASLFLIEHRFPHRGSGPRERRSVLMTNLFIAGLAGVTGLTIGFRTYLAVQLPVLLLAAVIGLWLFYVQHQFERTYWSRHSDWDPIRSALDGSSYYRLPRPLQWLSGNIGLHHIHHLNMRIPNYHLQACFDAIPELRAVTPLTLRTSLRSLRLNLWDEKQQRMVGFRSLKNRPAD